MVSEPNRTDGQEISRAGCEPQTATALRSTHDLGQLPGRNLLLDCRRWRRPMAFGYRRSSKRHFATGMPVRSAPITERRLHHVRLPDCRGYRCGGSNWALCGQRIEAGHPEQNGRHERMHRTLKESAPQANRRSQRRSFDQFREEYNQVRPHQALGMQTPAEIYTSSPRHFPARLKEPEYDTTVQVRRVQKRWRAGGKTRTCFIAMSCMANASVCCRWI